MDFLIYEGKVAIALAVFYMFFRLLLKKETFHRFNRVVLLGTAVLSFILPFCIITIYKQPEPASPAEALNAAVGEFSPIAASIPETPWWQLALAILFFAGAAYVLVRLVVSILIFIRTTRQGELVLEEDGCKVIVTEQDIAPFSWMRYIVLSRKDWEGPHESIITHEKAHIAFGHSIDLLLVDILSAFQWFNPAIWMLRADLQELHEYEADDAVLRSGVDLKEYQYLLIRKAVGKSGYSVANSFNHSILKNRITMMSRTKSPLRRGLRVLYALPLVCLSLALQAQTVIVPQEQDNKSIPITGRFDARPITPLYIKWEMGTETELTPLQFGHIDKNQIKEIKVLNNHSDIQKYTEKYGEKAGNGIVIVTMKKPQDLDDVVVVRFNEPDDGPVPFYLLKPDTYARFQGGDANEFPKWLSRQLFAPSVKVCKHTGTVRAGFVVDADGNVKDIEILDSVCEELDALVAKTIAKSPKWEPATANGKPVAQYLNVPVEFVLRQPEIQKK